MRAVAFTVDVDRDVNLACKGDVCSISNALNGDTSPRFCSSRAGLDDILEVLRENGVPGTFFWEGRSAEVMSRKEDISGLMEGHEVAVHGYDHEDFPGKETGVPLKREEVRRVLELADTALQEAFGPGKRGFRAPYQRTTEDLMRELADRGCLYDSSDTVRMVDGRVAPFRRENGVLEMPVCWTTDRHGRKIVSYLWPYHEGKRPLEDYLDLMDGFEDGLLVLANHSWHMRESFSNGLRSKEEVARGMRDLGALLRHAQDTGARFVRLADRAGCFGDL